MTNALDALIAEAKRTRRPKRASRPSRSAKELEELQNELRALKLAKMKPTQFLLLTRIQTCQNCGATHQSVNSELLVRRESPEFTHWQPASIEDTKRHPSLPRHHSVEHSRIPVCPKCFPATRAPFHFNEGEGNPALLEKPE